jgi:hypothetical protein
VYVTHPGRRDTFELAMHRRPFVLLFVAALIACGGTTVGPSNAGSRDGSTGSSGSSSGGSSSGSGGGSSSGSATRVPLHHRTGDQQCSQPAAAGNCSGGQPPDSCSSDAECTDAGLQARCINDGPLPGCHCTYDQCVHDTDCGGGKACACHGSTYVYDNGNSCVPGDCRVDSDCGTQSYCSPSDNPMSCGALAGYFCHTPNDQCVDDSDCGSNAACAYDAGAKLWTCKMVVLCG